VRMQFGSIVANSGANITYSSATLTNGFLSGIGLQSITGGTTFNNITTFNGSQLTLQAASNLNLTNSTIGGSLTSNGALQWTNGTLASSGALTVNTSANISGFENRGAIAINGTLTNSSSSLVSGGGSRITINPGGTLNVSTNALDLNGALLVNNGTITGTTNVNFGSVAKGGGVYGAVNVTDGGKFSPGNSPGSATTGSTTWNSGGSYIVEIADALAGTGIGWDTWNINGVLNLNATSTANGRFTISLSSMDALAANFDPHLDYTWPILHATDGISGFDSSAISLDSSSFKNNLSGGHFSIISAQNNLSVHFTAVPEPTSLALLAGICLLSTSRRQKGLSGRSL